MLGFLSVKESLKYWRSDKPYYGDELLVAPAKGISLKNCANSLQELERFRSLTDVGADEPLELLVSTQAQLRRGKQLSTRLIAKPLPDGSFFEIEHDLYVCSPELLFLLAASMVPLRSLIALGCELCGTYSLFSASSSAIRHAQITDVGSIRRYLNQVPGTHGIKLAKQALSCIADGSASPRETDVYMQYCMRPKLGSFGLRGVKLNHTLDLNDFPDARELSDMKKITPDLYWPKHKIAIEYESTKNHGAYASTRDLLSINQRKLAKDSTRRRTYEAMGIFALTVTEGEFYNYNDAERIAKLLARQMAKNDIPEDLDSLFRRSQLHEWLKTPIENRKDIL